MSTKDWKNNELTTLLTEKWGFSFSLLTESQDEEAVNEEQAEEVVEEATEEETVNEEQKEEVVEETVTEKQEELEEGGAAARTGNEEKDQGRERMHADRIHEDQESMTEAKVRQLIRQLIKEATTKKENK